MVTFNRLSLAKDLFGYMRLEWHGGAEIHIICTGESSEHAEAMFNAMQDQIKHGGLHISLVDEDDPETKITLGQLNLTNTQ